MRSEEWGKIEELLDAALELEPAERQEFLDGLDTPDLRGEVESLLACEQNTNGFLDAPALALSADFFDDESLTDARAGEPVGPYRIIREIGRGGMGAVFLAERADGEFEQKVALKVVRRSFADTDLARRFRQERQILASLNHPNIARLLDGGVTADGEPFLAMEYVEGVRIDNYADAQRLSTVERLRLFRQVCAAVQYAHQNLVIHRDLKPSNILVTAEGVPKLLDFGIAKLLDAEGDGAHTVTELGVMTPEYASPEQVSGQSVTTASDVYSLGVVLYELLAGRRPYRVKSRQPDEIARAIREQEPSKPSEAVSSPLSVVSGKRNGQLTTDNGQKANRQSPIGNRQLKGDLDNIVLMAMRKEPARRYASVAQFSEDIRRHLDGLPVLARKDTFKYRATKFVKRNKIAVAAATVVSLALIGGIIGVAWQARAAKAQARVAAQERDRARLEAAKAARINAFLQSIFASANPHWYSSGFGQRGEVRVVDVLEQAGRRIDVDFKNQPEIRAELHHTIGTTYLSLGRHEPAQTHFRAAVDAYRGLYGEQHPEVAEALYYLAASVLNSGDFAAANPLFRKSLEIFRAVDPNNTNVPYLLADFALSLSGVGETVAAEQAAREGLELARQRHGDEHVLTNSLLSTMGYIYSSRGDLYQAETYLQSALTNLSRMPNGKMSSPGTLEALGSLAVYKGEFEQAETYLREAFDLSRQTQNETNPNHISILLSLAEAHYFRGAYAESEREAASALDLLRRSGFLKSIHQLRGLSLLSVIHARTNRPARASAFLRDALTLFNDLPDTERFRREILLGEALILMKRESEARTVLLKANEFYARLYGEQNPSAVRARQRLEQLGAR